MLRRGRIRFDYVRFNKTNKASVQFVFQFDGTERGVFIRDFWGRVFENKFQLFSFATGMFARPFSYELNLSSSDRESPETWPYEPDINENRTGSWSNDFI